MEAGPLPFSTMMDSRLCSHATQPLHGSSRAIARHQRWKRLRILDMSISETASRLDLRAHPFFASGAGRQRDSILDQRGDSPARVCFLLTRGSRVGQAVGSPSACFYALLTGAASLAILWLMPNGGLKTGRRPFTSRAGTGRQRRACDGDGVSLRRRRRSILRLLQLATQR